MRSSLAGGLDALLRCSASDLVVPCSNRGAQALATQRAFERRVCARWEAVLAVYSNAFQYAPIIVACCRAHLVPSAAGLSFARTEGDLNAIFLREEDAPVVVQLPLQEGAGGADDAVHGATLEELVHADSAETNEQRSGRGGESVGEASGGGRERMAWMLPPPAS